MSTFATRSPGSSTPADDVLDDILKEIAVPVNVLKEAKDRRNLVLQIAMKHEAARACFYSGSIAHGTENSPLGDADCGLKVNRRFEAFRIFGPDAPEDKGPEEFVVMFAEFVLPRLRATYPQAEVNLDGNRAIKFEFNERVEFDDWGPVDPFVELIVGLERRDGPGIWIPNRREEAWDPADPEHHTYLMTEKDPKALRVHRAVLVRLGKRAVKRDATLHGRIQLMCSWNLSALALDLVDDTQSITAGLLAFLRGGATEIAVGLTEDPADAVEEPIKLPQGVTNEMAAARLHEMADTVEAALRASSRGGARAHLEELFGAEIQAIRAREDSRMRSASRKADPAALAGALGLPEAQKVTRSHGA